MQVLKGYLYFASVFELFTLYMIYSTGDVSKAIEIGFLADSNGVSEQPIVLAMTAAFISILGISRFLCAYDIHSKAIYLFTTMLHVIEACLFVGHPIYTGTLNPDFYAVAVMCIFLPLWMAYSYKSYTGASEKVEQTKPISG
eukprot:gene10738-3358_t